MDNTKAMQTALLIGAFVLAYNAYVWSGFFGYFLDPFWRKACIYFIMGSFSVTLILMGNSNVKSSKEINIRIVAALSILASNLMIIFNQFLLLKHPIYTVTLFNIMTIFAVLLFIFKSDKNGHV